MGLNILKCRADILGTIVDSYAGWLSVLGAMMYCVELYHG